MKKSIILLCAVMLALAVFGCQSAEKTNEVIDQLTGEESDRPGYIQLHEKPESLQDYVFLAVIALEPPYRESIENAGFKLPDDLKGYKIGMPFSIFVFDRQGQLLPNETIIACPIIINDDYVGRVVVKYNETEQKNEFEYYKDTLLPDIQKGTVDTEKVLAVGQIGSKTFVTDGSNLDIIVESDTPAPDEVTNNEIKAMAAIFKAAAAEEHSDICGLRVSVKIK